MCSLAGLVGLPALAADVDPRLLVLQQTDVPAGFTVDRRQTGPRTNEREAQGRARIRALLSRWGRIAGYQVEFERGTALVGSGVDLFRDASGASAMLAYYDREFRRSGIRGLRRRAIGLGAGGYLYGARASTALIVVVWREGRAFAGVVVSQLTQERALALARVQSRRIATALRR